MNIRELLMSWQVQEDTITKFEANEICTEDLPLLSLEDLKDFVPLVGPRNRLCAKIKAMTADAENNKPNEPSSNLIKGSVGSAPASIQLNQSQEAMLKEIVSVAANLDSDCEASGSDDEHFANTKKRCKKNVPSVSPDSDNEPLANIKKQSKNKVSSEAPTSEAYDLEAVLESAGGVGQLIMSVFKTKGALTDSDRGILAKIVINKETAGDFNKRVSRERAMFLATKVCELFPTELLSTWYRVEMRANGLNKVVKGRLIRRFYTQRRKFKKLGVITSNSDSEEEEEDVCGDLNSDSGESTSCSNSLTWLMNKNVTPWPRVESAWKETSKSRLKELQQPVELVEEIPENDTTKKRKKAQTKKVKTTNAKVASYTSKFPQIQEPAGWSLLEMDFEYLHKDALVKLDLQYNKLEKFVLHKLRQMDANILFDDFDEKPQSERFAFVFLSFSKLFPVATVGHVKSAHWRPSRQEMRDAFLLQVNSYGDLKTLLEAREKKLRKFNLTDQPLPIIIKEKDQEKVKFTCFVKADTLEYRNFESPLKAVDIAFKTYHALHACYPVEAEPMWLFLQKAVYGFTSRWDKHFDCVERLVGEFSKFQA